MTEAAVPARKHDDARRAYERMIRRRLRYADAAGRLRAGGIQMVWLLIVIAGAAIPLTEALKSDGWEWVSPVLGFVVVVASGLERIFSRTTVAAAAVDELRRDLARQRRQLLAGCGEYDGAVDPFRLYAERTEEAMLRYDQQVIAYNKQVVASSK